MNTHLRARGRRFAPMAGATLLLLGAAACGSSSNSDTTRPGGQEQARRYAQCIRDNGIPDFPDPDADGRFRGLAHEQQGNPTFRSAQEKCRALAPGGEHQKTGDPAFVEQARKFAQCVRENGAPDFPDPDAEGLFRGAGHEQQANPRFQAAREKCRGALPGGGGHR